MNATSAFSRGCGGSLSAQAAESFSNYMGSIYSRYQNLSGWLGDTLESVKRDHQNFMDSRMWEFSKRLGNDGQFVGRFEIGYLGDAKYQQQAQGFMRNYIMANPLMAALYQDGRASGYNGEISQLCNGVGRENYYYNKAIDGMMMVGDDGELTRTDYHTSRDGRVSLSVRERVDIHRTWNASNIHIAAGLFDPSNTKGDNFLSEEEVAKLRLEQESKEQ